jgi:hypothetical protein
MAKFYRHSRRPTSDFKQAAEPSSIETKAAMPADEGVEIIDPVGAQSANSFLGLAQCLDALFQANTFIIR